MSNLLGVLRFFPSSVFFGSSHLLKRKSSNPLNLRGKSSNFLAAANGVFHQENLRLSYQLIDAEFLANPNLGLILSRLIIRSGILGGKD